MREGFTAVGTACAAEVSMEVSGGAMVVEESSVEARTKAVPEAKTTHAVIDPMTALRMREDTGSNVSVSENQG